MSAKQCYVCHKNLTPKNDSREHIFLDSLGDPSPVSGILCRDCNNWLGEKVDYAFYNTFKELYKTVSGKLELVKMVVSNTSDTFIIPMKNQVIQNTPIKAQNTFHQHNNELFTARFLDMTDAKEFIEKKKKRARKNNQHIDFQIEKTASIPQFEIIPQIDKVLFTLEILKMATGYLHSKNYKGYILGDDIFPILFRYKNQADPDFLFKKTGIIYFDKIILPCLTNQELQNIHFLPGKSFATITNDHYLLISIIGLINVSIPLNLKAPLTDSY
ncbi:HNH endonuclease [Lactiplantibacillus plantarum]|uniref:HNH endonuclease n=1 Tax=Lactiplantibacillus plantarum TaxID=1590 RepID=UPI000CA20D6A|nr:HNH endonuclease [Lactiplantibacillus plantarum]AUS70735.1 hypothetical protein C1T23_00001 [Lactiplantibacillus plantarum]USZ13378.1 HNH endonuclease [Lactiplantibacillus plantarum]UVE91381.1 hypothetical protein KE630_10655 [Lactiplantibacillus plantarum]